MNTLETIVTLIFTPTAIVTVFAIILKKFFEQALSRDIENYKARLHAEFEHSKIRLENELQTKLFEYQTRFSLFHNKQAEVIGELYGRLSDTTEILRMVVNPVQLHSDNEQSEKVIEARDKYNALAEFFIRHRIYLSEEICDKVDAVLIALRLALAKYGIGQNPHDADHGLEMWHQAWKSISDEVPPLLKELERQFRQSVAVGMSDAHSLEGDSELKIKQEERP